MPPTDKISLKTFWETVELRLAACSAEQLARSCAPRRRRWRRTAGRRSWTGSARSRRDLAGIAREIEPEDLLADIADLAAEIEDAMEEAPEPEEHYEWGGYDDEEEDDPYAGFVEPLVALFDRAQAAFDYADKQLAA